MVVLDVHEERERERRDPDQQGGVSTRGAARATCGPRVRASETAGGERLRYDSAILQFGGRGKQPPVFLLGKTVGHPGQVIAHNPLQAGTGWRPGSHPVRRRRADHRVGPGPPPQVLLRQQLRVTGRTPRTGPAGSACRWRSSAAPGGGGTPAPGGTAPARPSSAATVGREPDQRVRRGPDVLDRPDARGRASRRAVSSSRSVTCQASSSRTTAVRERVPGQARVCRRGPGSAARSQNSTSRRSSERDEPQPEGVVGVVRVVGDAVHHIDDLRFEQRPRRRRTRRTPGRRASPLCRTNASRTSNDRFSPGKSG